MQTDINLEQVKAREKGEKSIHGVNSCTKMSTTYYQNSTIHYKTWWVWVAAVPHC